MHTYEIWIAVDPDGGASIATVRAEQVEELRSRGEIEAHARLLFKIHADTYEEASAAKCVKLGWSPYIPYGDPSECPNNCGSVVYPEGYAECPNCGVLSEEQRQKAIAARQTTGDLPLRLVVKSVEIVEAPGIPMTAYAPEDPSDFRCTLHVMIGPADRIVAEQVRVVVCSSKWLAKAVERDAFVWSERTLIVSAYDLKQILEFLTKLVNRCSGDSWGEVAAKLSREFEFQAA